MQLKIEETPEDIDDLGDAYLADYVELLRYDDARRPKPPPK